MSILGSMGMGDKGVIQKRLDEIIDYNDNAAEIFTVWFLGRDDLCFKNIRLTTLNPYWQRWEREGNNPEFRGINKDTVKEFLEYYVGHKVTNITGSLDDFRWSDVTEDLKQLSVNKLGNYKH